MAATEDEELDYHITFPSPFSNKVPNDDDDDEEVVQDDDEEPVMVLLGWAGCKEKHLAKYSDIYDQRCITIRYTAPTGDVFYAPEKLRVIAGKILEILTDLQIAHNPIFFHVFSNGGGMVYRHISELMHAPATRELADMRLAGVIFDSCPSERRLWTAAKAMMATKRQWNVMLRYTTAMLMLAYLVSVSVLSYVTRMFRRRPDTVDYFSAMRDDPAGCPQLYLYSKADQIVDHVSIEEHIRARRDRVHIESICWDDSAHVSHYREHREVYTTRCRDFLQHCINSL